MKESFDDLVFEEVDQRERDKQPNFLIITQCDTDQSKHNTDHEVPFEESGSQTIQAEFCHLPQHHI